MQGQHRAVHALPGLGIGLAQTRGTPSQALSSLPVPVTPNLGTLRIPVGAFPALPWMEFEQNLSSSTEPILLNGGFQHLELLGMSRSWAWRCGASLAPHPWDELGWDSAMGSTEGLSRGGGTELSSGCHPEEFLFPTFPRGSRNAALGLGSALPLHPQPALGRASAASGHQSHPSGHVRGREGAEQQIRKLNPPAKDWRVSCP